MKENTARTFSVRKMDKSGDSKQEMTLQEIQHEVSNGQFLFLDTDFADAGKVTEKELEGAKEILLTARLVGGA